MKAARPSQRRRGAILVATLVCLAIVTAIVTNMLVGALRVRRQSRVERDRRQCELLLAAGLDRAVLRMSAGESYVGEVWDLTADEIIDLGAGQVTIEVTRPAGSPQIRVTAEYPLGNEHSVRRSRRVHWKSTSPLSQE